MDVRIALLCAAASVCGAAVAAPPGLPLSGAGRDKLPPSDFAPAGRLQPDSGAGMSRQQAALAAQQINGGGKVLSVDAAADGWRVKLLKDGHVRIVFVPDN